MVQWELRFKYEMSSQAHVSETWSLDGGSVSGGKRTFGRCGIARASGSLDAGP